MNHTLFAGFLALVSFTASAQSFTAAALGTTSVSVGEQIDIRLEFETDLYNYGAYVDGDYEPYPANGDQDWLVRTSVGGSQSVSGLSFQSNAEFAFDIVKTTDVLVYEDSYSYKKIVDITLIPKSPGSFAFTPTVDWSFYYTSSYSENRATRGCYEIDFAVYSCSEWTYYWTPAVFSSSTASGSLSSDMLTIQSVPEPATVPLMIFGIAAMLALQKRREA